MPSVRSMSSPASTLLPVVTHEPSGIQPRLSKLGNSLTRVNRDRPTGVPWMPLPRAALEAMPQPVAASLDERRSPTEADADVAGSELNRQLRREPGSTQCGRVEPRDDLTHHRRDFPVLGHGRTQLAPEHGDAVQPLLENHPHQVADGVRIVGRRLQRLFFFQAEDGIRDYKVTGVQTCALPI